MKRLFPLFLALLLFAACNNNTKSPADMKKNSAGQTLEILVIADPNVYSGETRQLIDSIFGRPQEGLYETEPMFDIVNIPVSSYRNNEMYRVHRNILVCDIKSDNPDKVYMHIDDYAAPQVVFDFAVKDAASLRNYLRKYQKTILDEFYKAEHRRVARAFSGIRNHKLNNDIAQKFGFGLTFSDEYHLAREDSDFVWVRKEGKHFSLGLLINTFPYTNSKIFEEQQLLDRIDTVMRHYLLPPQEGSYSGMERRRDEQGEYLAPIIRRQVEFPNSPYCIETRGNWRSFGDFMGGPLLSYAFLTPDQKQVVLLIGYVYCPKNKPYTKRDLLMQLEGICYSFQMNTAE